MVLPETGFDRQQLYYTNPTLIIVRELRACVQRTWEEKKKIKVLYYIYSRWC